MNFWKKLKISQRIFYGFVVTLAGTVILSLVIFVGLGGISQSYERLLEGNQQKYFLNAFMNSIKVAEKTANYSKRFVTEGKMSIQLRDNIAIKSDMKALHKAGEDILLLIQEIFPEEYYEFERMLNQLEDTILHDFVENEDKNFAV